ncbi:MAG TPA: hypothetical protein VEG30_13505 [Terriglobales bacterium]|nr:hypothetical protein [Terriglobales bacterium]
MTQQEKKQRELSNAATAANPTRNLDLILELDRKMLEFCMGIYSISPREKLRMRAQIQRLHAAFKKQLAPEQ